MNSSLFRELNPIIKTWNSKFSFIIFKLNFNYVTIQFWPPSLSPLLLKNIFLWHGKILIQEEADKIDGMLNTLSLQV